MQTFKFYLKRNDGHRETHILYYQAQMKNRIKFQSIWTTKPIIGINFMKKAKIFFL